MTELVIRMSSEVVFKNATLNKATKEIFKVSDTMRKCAFSTALILKAVKQSECYKDDGFESVIEYAEKTFGFKKTTVYGLMNVADAFLTTDEKNKPVCLIDTADEHFETSQLIALLPLGKDGAQCAVANNDITPTMSVRDIRRKVKSIMAKDVEESTPAVEELATKIEESATEVEESVAEVEELATKIEDIYTSEGDVYIMINGHYVSTSLSQFSKCVDFKTLKQILY